MIFSIRLANWHSDAEALRMLRRVVFIEEQQVPEDMEWDAEAEENAARHWLALDEQGQPIATARLLPSGQLGRVAVLKDWRRRGVGHTLVQRVINHVDDPSRLFLHAQVDSIAFYRRLGFETEGKQFMEAGILHQTMRWER